MMALVPLDDLVGVSLTEHTGPTQTLTWETATDWDNAVDEAGVVHESTAGTAYSDATTIRKGYPAASPMLPTNLYWFYLCHETSGTTVNDFSGGNRDAAYAGPTLNQTGLLGTPAPSYDNTNDYIDAASDATGNYTSPFTVGGWINTANNSDRQIWWTAHGERYVFIDMGASAGQVRFYILDGSGKISSYSSLSANTWTLVLGAWDGTNSYLFIDGTQVDTTATGAPDAQSYNSRIGTYYDGSRPMNGRIGPLFFFTTALSEADATALDDVVHGESYLESATKSFTSATKPDLQNLSYSLNGETIIIDVIGSPAGTSETVSQTLDGTTSFNLTWANSHTNFRVKPRLSTSDPETTPTIGKIELTTP